MKQDCTSSPSTADETKRLQPLESNAFPEGTHLSEPEKPSGPAMKKCAEVKPATVGLRRKKDATDTPCTSWSYLFVHNRKVKAIEQQLQQDGIPHFVHKTIKYLPRRSNHGGMRQVETPSVSGLIFLQGHPRQLQAYLDEHLPMHKLCKNCSTGRVATIPCNQMEPFMRVSETEPDRLRFLLRPFVYYAQNRTLLRIVSGDYAGLEGYVIRIARDRRLVMDIGGMAVAISNVHAERFEEVDKNGDAKSRATFYKRNLHERHAFIDSFFHQVKTAQEVAAQTENIKMLLRQTHADVLSKRLDIKDAFSTFYFMIEEIGYYYAPFLDYVKDDLQPIIDAGRKVMQEIARIASTFKDEDQRQRYEAEYEELRTNYGYVFD